jgi:hypothetical protein
MELIGIREAARRLGVSDTAVHKAIRDGRLSAPAEEDRHPDNKRPRLRWPKVQEEWTANAKHPQKRPHTIAGGRPRKDGQPTAPPADRQPAPPAPREGEVVGYLEGQPHGGALKRAQDTPPPEGEMTLAQIQRARELTKLEIDQETLKKVRQESVSAAEQEKQGRTLASIVISGMYSIPDRISDELAGMSDPHAIAELLRQQIDSAVSELRRAYAPA